MLKIKKCNVDAKIPEYAHDNDSGMDLFSVQNLIIPKGEIRLVKTGIILELEKNTEAQVRPKSGLALKYGITVLNTPGTVDEGYRGEVGVILINHGKEDFKIEIGMKIAQMVIMSVLKPKIEIVEEVSETKRGVGGYGSTGIK